MPIAAETVRTILRVAEPGRRFAVKFDHGGFAQARFFSAQAGEASGNVQILDHIKRLLDAAVGMRGWCGKLYNRTVVITIGPKFDADWFITRIAPGLESLSPI